MVFLRMSIIMSEEKRRKETQNVHFPPLIVIYIKIKMFLWYIFMLLMDTQKIKLESHSL